MVSIITMASKVNFQIHFGPLVPSEEGRTFTVPHGASVSEEQEDQLILGDLQWRLSLHLL